MKTLSNTIQTLAAAAVLLGLAGAPATADARNENDRYGEVRLTRLHPEGSFGEDGAKKTLADRAQVSKVPWVGSWWAYKSNGIANCWDVYGADDCFENLDLLSPAAKLDKLLGQEGNIDHDGIKDYVTQVASLNPLATEKRDLTQKINRWMAKNPGGNWRETEDGTRYLEVVQEIETAEQNLPRIDVDTITEFEVMKHGQGVQGVEGWWGHCNAWAAAAIMDPEPRHSTTVDGIEFTAADVKAYLTEAWMEHRSSFYGSRAYEDPYDANGDGKTDWEDTELDYEDLTPAAFHIFTADQLGNKDKSFVIDRYTGGQVWNQPMRGYAMKMEALYENDTPEEVEVFQASYGWDGKGRINSRGKKSVYRVLVTTTIHWMTDGLPHDRLTEEHINELDDLSEYGNSWTIRRKYDDQVEIRTLTYELWLSAPLGDDAAEIIGDGVWKHGSMIGNQNHPDFAWQPQSQTGSRRDYENPHLPYDRVVAEILPGTLHVPDAPPPSVAPNLTFEAAPVLSIPDNDTAGVHSIISVTEDVEITSLTVIPNIKHTYRGDLEITLRKGRRWKIIKRKGDGGSADDLTDPIDVPHYIGDRTEGDWKLVIKDLAGQDTGSLDSWKIVFNQ